MSRASILVAALLCIVITSRAAQAQAPDPTGECTTTTTTTTHCTGAAAPYAARSSSSTVILAPPPPAPMVMPYPLALPSGWRLTRDSSGALWRERKGHGQPRLWAPGLALWLSSYLLVSFGGLAARESLTSIPLAGAFVGAARSNDAGGQIGWAVDGIVQLTGFILVVAGASLDGKLERLPVGVAPIALHGGGSGVALTGRF